MKAFFVIGFIFFNHLLYAPPGITMVWDDLRQNYPFEELLQVFENKRLEQAETLKIQQIQKIVKTIVIIESKGVYEAVGESGEVGAYQFMPKTWQLWCKTFYGTVLEMTPENQDLIAHLKVRHLLDKGFSPAQIASFWNCGSPKWEGKKGVNRFGVSYDVPSYVSHFMQVYKTIV